MNKLKLAWIVFLIGAIISGLTDAIFGVAVISSLVTLWTGMLFGRLTTLHELERKKL